MMKRYPYLPEILYTKYKMIWHNQENSLDTLYPYLQPYNVEVDNNGCIYITKGECPEGQNYPCFAAHLDTVHRGDPKPVLLQDTYLISTNGNGIGGDDKCGLVACLELLKALPYCKAVFFVEEESGAKGSRECDMNFFDDCRYVIEIDRRGSEDLIQQSGSTKLCDDEFADTLEKYGFKRDRGTFTDVNNLTNRGVSINTANVSSGYYNAHTGDEYVNLKELRRNIHKVLKFAQQEYLGDRVLFKTTKKYSIPKGFPSFLSKSSNEESDFGLCACCGKYSENLSYSSEKSSWVCEKCK